MKKNQYFTNIKKKNLYFATIEAEKNMYIVIKSVAGLKYVSIVAEASPAQSYSSLHVSLKHVVGPRYL